MSVIKTLTYTVFAADAIRMENGRLDVYFDENNTTTTVLQHNDDEITRFYFVRHGETDYNVTGKVQG